MRNFLCGLIVGLTLAGAVGYAGQFYDSKGNPAGPRGSIQSFDYFRQRQQFLDISAMRRMPEHDRLNQMTNPCGK